MSFLRPQRLRTRALVAVAASLCEEIGVSGGIRGMGTLESRIQKQKSKGRKRRDFTDDEIGKKIRMNEVEAVRN